MSKIDQVAIAELSTGQDHFLSSRRAAAVRKDLPLEDTPRITMNEVVKPGRSFSPQQSLQSVSQTWSVAGSVASMAGASQTKRLSLSYRGFRVPGYPCLAYLTGLVLLIAGFCLIAKLRPRTTARLLGILFLFFVIVLEASRLLGLRARTTFFETRAICGSVLILAETPEPENLHKPEPAADWLIKSGPFLFAFSTIVFGIDHLLYLRFAASLIPSWISWPLFGAYLAAFAFIAAGLSIGTRQSPSRKRF
jgi:uncharacterized membrane protein YphA (DoxX/SURF4 family)